MAYREDGLYLNGIWVAEVEVILNLVGNDLTKPDKLNASYSLTFDLPDTMALRDLLENAEQIDSGGVYPYRPLPAKLISDGEIVFTGIAKLDTFEAGWQVNLQASQVGLIELIRNKSIRSLDLARYDHDWTLAVITTLAGKTSGVIYPVVNYGTFDKDVFASDTLFPSVYVHTLINQILSEAGYRAAGSWLDDELIKRLALPFVDDTPQSRDSEWVEDRTARVTVSSEQILATPYQLSSADIDIILPFSIDNDGPENRDGKQDNFKPPLTAYVCDVAMRLRVQASQPFIVSILHGAMESMLIVEKNGVNVAQEYFSVSGPYNTTGAKTDIITLDELINCRVGDQIRIRFVFQKRTTFVGMLSTVSLMPNKTWASFTPDASIRPGDDWLVARNLPEMTCMDLLKSIALMSSASFQVDDFRKTLDLVKLDTIVSGTSSALDWSSRVEESVEPKLNVTLSPYGIKNYVRWKMFDFGVELAKTKIGSTNSANANPRPLQFGDGVITSGAENLPALTELFELPFAACQNSDEVLSGYGNPILIRTRRLTGSGNDITVERQSTTPRLILVEPSKTLTVRANLLTPENVVRNEPVTLTACWWGIRPYGASIETGNAFTLAFDKVSGLQREQTLISRYFNGLKRILRRPRSLSVSMHLNPEDVTALDFSVPIRLQKVRIGSLDVNDSFFYLNMVQNFTPGHTCIVQLVPYY